MAVAGSVSPLGSGFFLLAGSGLFISGALIARRHRAGAWTFLAVFAGTLTWSLRNLEVGGSSLSERLIGPAPLLVIFTLLLPALCQMASAPGSDAVRGADDRHDRRWRVGQPRRAARPPDRHLLCANTSDDPNAIVTAATAAADAFLTVYGMPAQPVEVKL
jgi:hypothetical protein